MMAISGEAFMDAGRCVTDLLARNLLNAFASTIWWVLCRGGTQGRRGRLRGHDRAQFRASTDAGLAARLQLACLHPAFLGRSDPCPCASSSTSLPALPPCNYPPPPARRFTPLVIRMACFLLAAGWGALTGAAYYALHHGSKLEATPGLNATLLGAAVYVVAQFILAFLGGILLSVLDAGGCCCPGCGALGARGGGAAGPGPGCMPRRRVATLSCLPSWPRWWVLCSCVHLCFSAHAARTWAPLHTHASPPRAPLAPPPPHPLPVFICWALDKDSQTVSHPEVYAGACAGQRPHWPRTLSLHLCGVACHGQGLAAAPLPKLAVVGLAREAEGLPCCSARLDI